VEGEERGKERDKGKGEGEREIRGNVTKGKRGERERREGEEIQRMKGKLR